MEEYILNRLDYPAISATMLIPLAGIVALLIIKDARIVRYISLASAIITFIIASPLYMFFDRNTYKAQFVERYLWIPAWDVHYTIGVDGISAPFILLITLIIPICVLISWQSINHRVKAFYICLLSMETIMIGLFVSLDLLQFFIFWEAMLIPMFLLIGVWGGKDRMYAAMKFLIFTLGGSVFMLAGIAALYFLGDGTFDILRLSKINLPINIQLWLFLAFFIAFAVKIPIVPFHTWLPIAYREAPTAATVLMAAILAKMGTYGFLRVSFPLFPDAARLLIDPLIALSVLSIIYAAYMALAEVDLKRLIAYSSLSHMGFIALGIFTLNKAGVEGGTLQMINHGIITGALFLLVGTIYERTETLLINEHKGYAKSLPIFATIFTIFALANIGMPGLSYFIGEFLILSGAFKASALFASISIFGILLSVTYMGWLYYRLILDSSSHNINSIKDINRIEIMVFLPLVFLTIYIGLQPQTILSIMDASLSNLIERLGTERTGLDGIKSISEMLR